MYNIFFISNCSKLILNQFLNHFKHFKISGFIVVIFFHDYFTSIILKHFELSLCMKCAI